MIYYLGSLVQFSPAAGRVGHCRHIPLCVGSTPRVPATLGLPRTGVSVLSPSTLLRLPAAVYGAGPALSAVPVFVFSTTARIRLHLRVCLPRPQRPRQPKACAGSPLRGAPFPFRRAGRAARGSAHSPRVRCAFSLRGEQPGQPEARAFAEDFCVYVHQ